LCALTNLTLIESGGIYKDWSFFHFLNLSPRLILGWLIVRHHIVRGGRKVSHFWKWPLPRADKENASRCPRGSSTNGPSRFS